MGKQKGEKQGISSAKAAELLAKGRGQAAGGGFGGYSGTAPAAPGGFAFGAKYIGQVASVLPGAGSGASGSGAGAGEGAALRAAIIPADLDGELSQQLQKLSKRDATTKLKALQALKQLVRDKDAADVQAAVPPWAYLYGKLVMDSSRAVRAEASQVMAALATALGRGLAPYLKSLVPCWWLAQFDGYAEAAAAARAGLAAAFPASKQRDVLLFCRSEVVQLLADNLVSTPQSLGDPKKEAAEDLQDRHERVLASTCSAAGALLELLFPSGAAAALLAVEEGREGDTSGSGKGNGQASVLEGIGAMLRQPALFKGVVQSKAPMVRRAGYSLVALVARRFPGLLQDYLSEAAPAVLGALGEKEPSNHPAMWDAVLSFAKAYPQAWAHVNLQKAVLPRVWALLRHGCYGSAEGSFQAVLPLVTLLPPEALGPSPGFFTSLHTSVWSGLEAVPDAAGRRAAAVCFQECLLFALLKADQLAGGGEFTPQPSQTAMDPGQRFSKEVLEAVLPQTVLPAATSEGGDASVADLAAGVLAGAAARLAAGSAAPAAPRLALLLRLAGSYLSFAAQQSLEQGSLERAVGGEEAAKTLEQELGKQLGQPSSGVAFERVAALAGALAGAVGAQQDLVGEHVARPLIAVLLPEVRAGTAPPAASTLLATLLKRFPQHAALPAEGKEGVAAPPMHESAPAAGAEGAAAAAAAGVPAAGAEGSGLSGEMAALRLHQSASYTIESLLRRCVSEGESQDEAALAATCDLLLSCLPQVADPGRKFGETLLELLAPRAGGGSPQVAAAAMLVKHLVAGGHAGLSVAGCRSLDADKAGRLLTAAIVSPPEAAPTGAAATLAGAADVGQLADLLTLLLAGDGAHSLLSLAAQADVLEELLSLLDHAAPAEPQPGDSTAAPDKQTLTAALHVLHGTMAGQGHSPAASAEATAVATGRAASEELPHGLLDLRLRLLAAVFRLLAQQAAGDAVRAAHAAADSAGEEEEEGSEAGSEDEELAVTQPSSPLHGEVARLAREIWSHGPHILALVQAASPAQRTVLAAATQSALLHAITHISAAAEGPSAAGAAAERLARLVLLALAGCCGTDPAAQAQLLQPLFVGDGLAAQPGGLVQYSAAQAAFLLALGQAVGFGMLLGAAPAPAAAAVGLLSTLTPPGGREADTGDVAAPLLEHLLQEAAASRPQLLSACLEAALQGALHSEQQAAAEEAGSSSAAAGDGRAAAVLRLLLRAALTADAPAAARSAAAAFFCSSIADAGLPLPLLQVVLPVAAPAVRQDPELLQQSGLPGLAVGLCEAVHASSAAQQAAVLVSCFPVPPVPPIASTPPAGRAAAATQQQQQQQQPAAASSSSYSKGDAVWYRERDGTWVEGKVASVDVTHDPPSYGVELPSGSVRETEAHRLQRRQPGASPPPAEPAAPAAAAAAAARAAAARQAAAPVFAVPHSTEAERAALLAAVEAQLGAAAAAAAGEGLPATPALRAAHAELALRGLAYCWQQLSSRQWELLLGALKAGLGGCATQLEELACQEAAAAAQSAVAVAGADLGGPRGALQFWRRLQQKGVVERSQKAQAEVAKLGATLQHALEAAQRDVLPVLHPWLRAYALAAATSARAVALPQTEWQASEAAACADVLQGYVALGALLGAVGPTGRANAAALQSWLDGGAGGAATDGWQALLSQQALSTLREADESYLQVALARANTLEEGTGSDAVGALLSLALQPGGPHCLRVVAYEALLLHPALLRALCASEGVSEEALEQSEVDSADSAAMLEQVMVRPELAAAVADHTHPALLPAWALLAAHALALPPDSHGRRLLVQTLKDAHALVPGVLDALVPHLPLAEGSGGRRGGRTPSRTSSASSTQATASEPATLSTADASAASQFLALGLPEDEASTLRLATQLYSALLQALPASARLWFSDLRDRGTAAAVERYTSSAVSPGLLAAEFAAVTSAAAAFGKFDKFSARANPTSREVVAVMEVEDGHLLELVVKLPASMPLRAPELECRKRVGVTEGRLRKWLLSIAAFLRTQNGSVAEAISLWKRNVDEEFEGQEECLICYSIIQPTNGQLPRLTCKTCRKRFHSSCLYKWFKSSGKATCVHCQSVW